MRKNLFYIGILFSTFTTTVSAQKIVEKTFIDTRIATPLKKSNIDLTATENSIKQSIANNLESFSVNLPNQNNKLEKFILTDRQLLNEDLQAKFPLIKSFVGYSTSDPTKKISLSYSPERGINSLIYSSTEKYFIQKKGTSYQVLNETAIPGLANFDCGTITEETTNLSARNADFNNPATKRKYKIAVATDFDFNTFIAGENQVPTAAISTAAVTEILTYLAPVYENDLSITFELIANNDQVSYLTRESDPFTTQNLNLKTQTELDTKIGAANYDVGMLFTEKTGGGNAGGIGTVCKANKGSQYSGISDADLVTFAVSIVAHEMGHQFGANHTHSRNEYTNAGREVGSGVTIMGYAGVTGSHDVTTEDKTLRQFNHYNLRQINSYLATQSCGVSTPSVNTPPVTTVGSNYAIPKGTAFKLTGSATDADNDALTYSWEQSNPLAANASTQRFNDTGSNNLEGANFRVYPHSNNPTAYFPPLDQVLKGELRSTWNTVSDVARNMNFVLQVRDNKAGGGQIDSKEVVLAVKAVGPFQITGLNLNQTLVSGQPFNLTWDVAGTDANDINVSNVAVKLTTDNGATFTTLLASTPNNGQASVTIPSEVSAESAYLVIEAIDNIFYAVSPQLAINYEIALNCQTFENTTPKAIPDRTGNTPGSANQILNITNQTGTLENYTLITDVDHTYSGDLIFLFAKIGVDQMYNTMMYETCGSTPNFKYGFTKYGGNTYTNCGIEGAKITGTSLDYDRYENQPLNGQYHFNFFDNGPGDVGTINRVAIETCAREARNLSVADIATKNEFNIFPNPNNGNFNVRLTTKSSNFTAEVINLAGQSVFTTKFNAISTSSNDYSINVSHLPKGVYLVKVNDGVQTQTKKLIIK